MKYKKSMFIVLLAIFLFSLTGVFASEMDTPVASDDTGQVALSVNDEGIDDNLQTGEENTKLAVDENDETQSSESGPEILTENKFTYSDLRDKIGSGGNINLTKGTYTYNDGDGDTIEISNSGVINGNGAVIDMNGSNMRAFYVEGFDVTIKNLTIKNANYDGYGGAIYFYRDSTVENCNFVDNKATGDYSYGGAVYFSSNGEVTNCNFTNNSASYGGAIRFKGEGTVTNCNFTNNQAYSGGAIYMGSGIVSNCNFTNNSVEGDGGAVYFKSNGNVTNCNFTDNEATNYGGAVFFLNNGEVTNCNFTDNTATRDGGAVYFYQGTGEVTNCNFTDNTATRDGGAVYFYQGTGEVTNCNFTDNQATDDGGAVYFDNTGSAINCNFVNNSATGEGSWGGAIYMGSGIVSNCNFTDNTASDWGGAVFFNGNGDVTNCNFTNNLATYGGGAVFFKQQGNVSNCNFTGNNGTTGSAIYFYSTSDTKTVSNSIFLNNRANAEALDVVKNDNNITITFTGRNNLLNAIYSPDEVTFTNVTYWGANGITTVSATLSGSNKATGQNITVGVVVNNELVLSEVMATNENGTIVLNINAGDNYYISARHDTDSYYTEAETTISNNINVNIISQTTTNKTVNITAKSNIFSEVMPGKLLFILPNGANITANYAGNGAWWALHTFDDYAAYNVTASYIGLDNVSLSNATITISKAETELTAKAITATYNSNKKLIISLKDVNGKPLGGVKVTVKIKSDKSYITDANGQVIISVGKLTPKTYNVKIAFKENADFRGSQATVRVTVKKAKSKITAKKKTVKKAKYSVTLKSGKNSIKKVKVLFKIKKKTFKAKTDKKGKATFKIKKLKKGTYTARLTFKGNKYYKKSTKKVRLRVR